MGHDDLILRYPVRGSERGIDQCQKSKDVDVKGGKENERDDEDNDDICSFYNFRERHVVVHTYSSDHVNEYLPSLLFFLKPGLTAGKRPEASDGPFTQTS